MLSHEFEQFIASHPEKDVIEKIMDLAYKGNDGLYNFGTHLLGTLSGCVTFSTIGLSAADRHQDESNREAYEELLSLLDRLPRSRQSRAIATQLLTTHAGRNKSMKSALVRFLQSC